MHLAFSHPDCYRRYRNFTDSGKTAADFPSQTFTAGEDFHLAPKNIHFGFIISLSGWAVNSFLFVIFNVFFFTKKVIDAILNMYVLIKER